MPKTKEMSEVAENATIERSEFDAVMKKLLQAGKPISKDRISARIKIFGPSASRGAKRSGQRSVLHTATPPLSADE